jgi:hypothetical protein
MYQITYFFAYPLLPLSSTSNVNYNYFIKFQPFLYLQTIVQWFVKLGCVFLNTIF